VHTIKENGCGPWREGEIICDRKNAKAQKGEPEV